MEKSRKSNFDILKVIAILGIILHHYALWTDWQFERGLHLNKVVTDTLLIGGKLGVNLFIMITGFFMIYSRPKLKSILNIWIEATMISVVLYFILINFHVNGLKFTVQTFFMRLLPVVFNQYWFITAYTLLYFSIPILNKLILSTNVNKLKKAMIFLFIVLSLWPYLYYSAGVNFAFPVWFMFLYFIGAFIRINETNIRKYPVKKLLYYIICSFFFLIIINIILILILNKPDSLFFKVIKLLGWHENIFYTRDCSPLLLIMAVSIFSLFLKLDIKYKKIYTVLSKGALGAYLFQSAPWFSVKVLWPILVNADRFTSSKVILLYGIFSILIIYLAGLTFYYLLQPINNFVLNSILRISNR